MPHFKTPMVLVLAGLPALASEPADPSFSCARVRSGSIAEMICQTPALAKLDQQLAAVYRQASAKAGNPHRPLLKAEQRGWIKGRNECWKAEDRGQCVTASYRLRIAELQARYALLKGTGPLFFECDGIPTKQVLATYYPSEPPTAVIEFGDSSSLMYQQPAASGSRYQGRNESFWEHQGEVTVVWGHEAPQMKCQARAGGARQ
ncbi:MliC family protein [Pseudomonas sp. SA3-5]|uniref:MliC family protein n=1 Tax=Pseudomonas aestuarii TaxID=3018340 RepID=A0ABT4XKF6_9PSED|nr:MliC family protein [Pseudomonas aestuarii]MDA7088588.1 MliC family protein [Pseudomonas aestuarii]